MPESLEPETSPSDLQNWYHGKNALIVNIGLAIIVLFFLIAVIVRWVNSPPDVENIRADQVDNKLVIQVEVLNGNGIPNILEPAITHLRQSGFDVVEKGNYHSFNVEKSVVIDRIGHQKAAQKLAESLGLTHEQILTQISNEYYTDMTVVLGRDFRNLTPFKK